MTIRVSPDSFDPGVELAAFLAKSVGAGAVVTFTGLVRAVPGSDLQILTLECYPDLAEVQLRDLEAAALFRFGLLRAAIIHRYGALHPGEPIVQVMTLAPHRRAAFEGAEFLMDFLKTDAAFWKKETTGSGEFWVEAHTADDAAKARWS